MGKFLNLFSRQRPSTWASPYYVDKKWQWFGWRFHFTWRDATGLMGRFGGGWNWKVGVQWGCTSAIICLLVCELCISKPKKKEQEK